MSIVRERYRQWSYNRGSKVRYWNFWRDERPEEMWLSRFITAHFGKTPRINFTSVLGPAEMMNDHRPGLNVFYTGENLHAERFAAHQQRLSQQHYDLVLGFDHEGPGNYMRLPLWVLWHFSPEATYDEVCETVERMRYPVIGDKELFCALVCSHDSNGLRGEMMDALCHLGQVHSAGAFRHNTDDLVDECGNDKQRFLVRYRYNICPENGDSDGYVTEKIFDAMLAGCVPIYSGSFNSPEPAVINHRAALLWQPGGDNDELLNRIEQMEHDHDLWCRYASQPRLLPGAEDVVWEFYVDLKEKFKELL